VTRGKAGPAERTVEPGFVPDPTPSLPVRALLHLVRLYQVGLSPLLGPRCRFEPTCSQYVAEALSIHGVWRGGLLGLWRLLRCHPLSKGGYEPVPGSARRAVGERPSPSASPAVKGALHSNTPLDDTSNEVG
jgi:putative membrane protein insertion efficiency factor